MFRKIHLPQWWYARWLPAQVLSGPFKGMLYSRKSTGSVLLPKLLGTYELELHPFFLSITDGQYDHFIDVGAGEGYYAVGLCYRFSKAKMLAFETTRSGRRNIKQLARKNSVNNRVKIRGKCMPADLNAILETTQAPLVIIDVEGFEYTLLDPALVPGLIRSDFLVELHPDRIDNIEEIINRRFAGTHELEHIPQVEKRPIPADINLPEYLTQRSEYLVQEFRGPQSWLIGRAYHKHPIEHRI